MQARRSLTLSMALFAITAAGCREKTAVVPDFNTQAVELPGGEKIQAEVVFQPRDMARGMMFRETFPPDRGMLFLHAQDGRHPYWMYNCRIPLDIIWMDSERRIQEIAANAPPCPGPPEQCPKYGGNVEARYVLELAGGAAAKYGLDIGDQLRF